MQKKILQKLHDGHQGIQDAICAVWWPGISKQINDVIEQCSICVRDSSTRREPRTYARSPMAKNRNRLVLPEEIQLHTDHRLLFYIDSLK